MCDLEPTIDKAELLQLNQLNFLPWEFLLVKKLEIEKPKTTIISFENCILGGLTFFRSPTFLLIKILREGN